MAHLSPDHSKKQRQFDKVARGIRPLVEAWFGRDAATAILDQARAEFAALIPHIPYVGGFRNLLSPNLVAGAWILALVRALERRGIGLEKIGDFIQAITMAYCNRRRVRWLLRAKSWLYFSALGAWLWKSQARRSQRRAYAGDWVFDYIEGDGKNFDYGLDYSECGLCKFFQAQGAEALMPYLCRLDFPMSALAGSGLERTTTLAEGSSRCDFRFKRGRAVTQGV